MPTKKLNIITMFNIFKRNSLVLLSIMSNILAKNYSYRNASIGLFREALMAGINPKIIPTAIDINTARSSPSKVI